MLPIFAKNKNYAELAVNNKSNKIKLPVIPEFKDIPSIQECPNGVYEGYRYSYVFETLKGDKYKTAEGNRLTRSKAVKHKGSYQVKDGKISEIKNFSGMTEVGAALQGASYGKVKNPNDTKIRIDYDGFKIPKNINKSFSMNDNRGRFTGNLGKPTVTISKDNTIMRGKNDRTNGNDEFNQTRQPNAMSNVSLEWNKDRTFHLAIEPWVTTPLVSDSDDGFYIGTLKGDKLDTGKKVLTLAIKINIDNPESIICLIKNQKAYLFKKSQLVDNSGSKLFSDNSETEFIKHKPDGSWGIISHKTGDFWPQNYKSKESALAALRGYHANKGFSDKLYADPTNAQVTSQVQQSGSDVQPVDPNQSASQAQPQSQSIQINKSKKGEEKDKEEEEKVNQNQPQDIVPKVENKVNQIGDDGINYKFKFDLSDPEFEMDSIIGTLLFSVSFGHLLHLVNSSYSVHMAMDEYYKQMPELVDALAENYLATTSTAEFKICIAPESVDPVPYLEKLQEYVSKFEQEKLSDAPKFASLIDDALKLIGSTLYKLKRLNSGRRIFSFNDSDTDSFKLFSTGKSSLDGWKSTIKTAIETYIKKFKKSPVKEIRIKDDKSVQQYVNNNVVDDDSAVTILSSIVDSMTDAVKSGFGK